MQTNLIQIPAVPAFGRGSAFYLAAVVFIVFAAAFDIPFLQEFGCPIIQWMKGPLAVFIFIAVIIAVCVMGMIMKMDWSRIISVAIIFGILTGLGGFLANNSYIQRVTGLSACLQ
jgi:type IV secretory pathway VirB2 component (pilin)